MKYNVAITFDQDYGGYVVDVPVLFGCIGQGKTLDGALANIKDAIHGWTEVANRHGSFVSSEPQKIFLGEVTV